MRAAFEAISEDDRHTAPQILDLARVETRAFGRWLMAGRVISGLDHALMRRFGLDGEGPEAGAAPLPFLLAMGAAHVNQLDAQHDRLSIPVIDPRDGIAPAPARPIAA